METQTSTEQASFGMGCFWCSEAVFQRTEGVLGVVSGYQGGTVPHPTYKQVCAGDTGHAEVVQVTFDPERVSYAALLDVFWKAHDPTQPDGQGADIGTQYRSVIFTYSDAQQQAAEASRTAAEASGRFAKPIVTEILPAPTFYPAEDYHQDFYEGNRGYPYCRAVITPKLEKLGMDA